MNSVFSATVEKIETRRDGTVKVSLGTQILTEDSERTLFSLRRAGEGVKCLLSSDHITSEQAEVISETPLELPKGKSQSQRLRAVMFRYWEAKYGPVKDSAPFKNFYEDKIESFIEHYKSLLDELD